MHSRLITLLLPALLLALNHPTTAQWTNNALRGMVTVSDVHNSNDYSITFPLANGNTLVTWSWGSLSWSHRKYQVYTPKGVPLLPEDGLFVIHEHRLFGGECFIVPDGQGGAIMIFTVDPHEHVYGQRIDSVGRKLWGNQGLPLAVWPDDDEMYFKDVSCDSLGNIFISWCLSMGWINYTYVQKVNTDGERLWGPYGVQTCGGISDGDYQESVPDMRGGVFDIWEDNRVGSIETYHLFAQHLDAEGQPLWEINGIPLYQPGTTLLIGVGLGGMTGAVSDGYGGAVVSLSTVTNWYLLRMDDRGEVLWLHNHTYGLECWTENPVLHPTDGSIWLPTVEQRSGEMHQYLYRFDLMGNPIFGNNGLQLAGDGWGSMPVIAPTRNGAIALSTTGYGDISHLHASRIDSSGMIEWVRDVNIWPGPHFYLKVSCAPDGSDGLVCAWTDERYYTVPWDTDLLAQRVQWNGVLGAGLGPLEPQYTRFHPQKKLDMSGDIITFTLSEPGEIKLELFNLLGQRVMILEEGYRMSGDYSTPFDDRGLASGIYWLRLSTSVDQLILKVMVLR